MLRRLAVLVLVLVGGLLAGCGGGADDPPSAGPSPGSTPTPTASAPPSAPVLPEAAKANTKAGVVAFARHYVDLINHAQATGDTKSLAAVELPGCRSCRDGRNYIEGIYKAGGSIEGGAWKIVQVIAVLPNKDIEGYNVDLAIRFGPQTIHRSAGDDTTLRGGQLPVTVFAARQSDAWKVREWTRGR